MVLFAKEFNGKAIHPHPCPLPSRERGLKNRPSIGGWDKGEGVGMCPYL